MYKALLIAVMCAVSACQSRYADFFPYHDNGTKKPSFTLLPVVDDTHNPLLKGFSEELTKAVRNRLKRTGKTYSPPIAEMRRDLGSASAKELADTKDLKMFSRFKGSDFVVVLDTVDCQVVPYKRGTIKPLYPADIDHDTAKVLMIAMRLEIVDLKGKEPRIARMELVKSNHMITDEVLEQAEKGNMQALELVRSRLARDLANKIEETVCIKK